MIALSKFGIPAVPLDRSLQIIKLIITALQDGQYHSGQALGEALNISRTAIWKHIQFMTDTLQLPLRSKPGQGYCLTPPILLLNTTQIKQGLLPQVQNQIFDIQCFDQIPSTSQYLYQQIHETDLSNRLCLAEMQTAGIGRRGQSWQSPFGYNVYYSLLWHFEQSPQVLIGLSIMMAIVICRVLSQFNLPNGLQLKWPNDIFFDGKKLAGILVEMRAQNSGMSHCVMSVGINGFLPNIVAHPIDQPWTDFYRMTGQTFDRNRFITDLTNALVPAIKIYQQQGLTPFLPEWRIYDCFYQKNITLLHQNGQRTSGVCQGITEQGLLALTCQKTDKTLCFHSGQVSIEKRSSIR